MASLYGKYELLERIGSGGMAEVFRARLPGIAGFEKIVVIKRLHPQFASDPGVVQMFVNEAKLAAGVQHKNVVQVYELGRLDNGDLFIVMEYVNGVDLKKLLRHAERAGIRIPSWFSVYVVAEVLEALNHAYDLVDSHGRRRNIVHRDVSPENIFISQYGDVKLGDFGVARDDTRPDPFAHEAKGKLGYMAPEQLTGDRLDQRCDVFSAGVVLWECLTQSRLFRGESDPETMNLLLHGPRTPPSRIARDLPESLDPIVLWTLHVDRTKRTPTSRAMQEQLLYVLHEMRGNVGPVDVRTALKEMLDIGASSEEATIAEVGDELIVSEKVIEKAIEQVIELDSAMVVDDQMLADVWDDYGTEPPLELVEELDTVDERRPKVSDPEPPSPEDPSWDGTYAIISPKLRKAQGGPETADIVQGRLVYEAPIRAKPSQADTGDIIREPPPRENTSQPGSARMWSPYDGPFPFWTRLQNEDAFGPLGFEELWALIRNWTAKEGKRTLLVSADRKRWTPLSRFLTLVEHDTFDEKPPSIGPISGTLGTPSLVALLGDICSRHQAGKLSLIQGTGERAEIHISAGLPVYVTSDVPALETAQLIVDCRVLDRGMMISCMHSALQDEKPLATAIAQRTKIDFAERRPKLLLARLEALLDWMGARYVFTPSSAPTGHPPIMRSLYSLLLEVVQRKRSPESLRAELLPLLGMRFERTERFDHAMVRLDIPAHEVEGLGPFGFTRTLDEAVRTSPGGARFAWSAAYVLLELGFIGARARVLT